MKVKKIQKPLLKTFKPFAIEITFEQQEEATEFYHLFNFYPLVQSVPHLDDEAIRNAMDMYLCAGWGEFVDRLRENMGYNNENNKSK